VSWGRTAALVTAALGLGSTAAADVSKLDKEHVTIEARAQTPHKNKVCCGYPLAEELGFRLTFYWQARQGKYLDHYDRKSFFRWKYDDLYTPNGDYIGTFHERFIAELKMEGAGWLWDGRVINWAGRCSYGVGTCFVFMDRNKYPYGRGAGPRPLEPFKSIAVDRRLIQLGETLYVPEFDGMVLPTGEIHDGCVRADDVGGAIRKRLVDFFVVELPNFRWVSDQLWGLRRFTPHVEDPRCDYMRRR
jgi:3D (Asp-Asp-Asp) domain-containing protein